MATGALLLSPLNVSEGRRPAVVDRIASAAARSCHLLDVHCDPDHNRSVLTLAGSAPELIEGIVDAAAEAVRLIDLNRHEGVHPRRGAVDVVPFVSLRGKHTDPEAVSSAVACAKRLWDQLGIPCFLYGMAAEKKGSAASTALPSVRRLGFAGLGPDFGGPLPHPSAGWAAVGARGPLVAYNVNLDSRADGLAKKIALAVRQDESLAKCVRALGFPLASRGLVQVSCNIVEPQISPIPSVFAAISQMAGDAGVDVFESELVGLAPSAAFADRDPASLLFRLEPKLLEPCLAAAGLLD